MVENGLGLDVSSMTNRNSTPSQRRRTLASQIAQAYRTAHEALSAALSMVLFLGIGYLADQQIGCSPVLTICGACLGFVVAGASLRALLRRLDQETAKTKMQKPENEEGQSQ